MVDLLVAEDVNVLSQLRPTSFRGIGFPSLVVEASGGHGVVPHKRVDRDGWRLENTGRDSISISLKIPFINTLWRGTTETWGELFPSTYRRMLTAIQDRTTGEFEHPIYGVLQVKVLQWAETLDPQFRGGPTLQLKLMQSVDEGDADALALPSDFSLALTSAALLDTAAPTALSKFGIESFADFVRQLQTIGSQATLAASQTAAKIDRVVAQASYVGQFFGPENPVLYDASDRYVSSVRGIQRELAATSKTKTSYRTERLASVAAIAQRTGNTPAEILALNPWIGRSPFVPAFVDVRVYSRSV